MPTLIDDPVAGVIRKMRSVTAITDLVGQRISVWGDHRSTSAASTPYIVVQEVDGFDERHLEGHANLAGATVQVDCVGSTSESAHDVRAAAKAAWRAVTREEVTVTGGVFRIESVEITGSNERRGSPQGGRNEPRYIRSFDLTLYYRTG